MICGGWKRACGEGQCTCRQASRAWGRSASCPGRPGSACGRRSFWSPWRWAAPAATSTGTLPPCRAQVRNVPWHAWRMRLWQPLGRPAGQVPLWTQHGATEAWQPCTHGQPRHRRPPAPALTAQRRRFTRFSGELFGGLIALLFLQQAVRGAVSEFRRAPAGAARRRRPAWHRMRPCSRASPGAAGCPCGLHVRGLPKTSRQQRA